MCGLQSGQVTLPLSYYLVGVLFGLTTFFLVSVHRATVCRGGVLREVSVGLKSGQATVQILLLHVA